MNKTDPQIHYPASSTENYRRVQRMLDMEVLVCKQYDFYCSKKDFIEITKQYKRFENNPSKGLLYIEDGFIAYSTNEKTLNMIIYADSYDKVDEFRKVFSDLKEVKANIDWIYSSQGHSIMVPITDAKAPLDEFYPFIDGTVNDYYDRFMHSDQNILILIGPPGTGKSTFVRGLLQQTGMSATVSYDPEVLKSDSLFANFIDGNSAFLIMEDSDTFLKPRKDGNTMISKFLNIGDGLVTMPNKKLIFTTNLPSIADIDEAMTRPGRCFDIIDFRALTGDEADIVRTKVGSEKTGVGGTLAEIMNGRTNPKPSAKTKFGFI